MQLKGKTLARFFLPAMMMLLLTSTLVYGVFTRGRPAPVPAKYQLYPGVTYQRIIRYLPHAMIAHIVIIDRKNANYSYVITRPDEIDRPAGPLDARTTSQFLEEYGVQIAINGDGFFPWWSNNPMDYYPHIGDPVTPNGFSAAFGEIYARGSQDPTPEPTLYISRMNELVFNRIPGRVHHAISGDRMLMLGGEIVDGLDDEDIDPRTAIGVNRNGRWVYLVVVDGRQPFYSAGASLQELADLMKDLGAFYAMNLDGGGSSTLVVQGADGGAVILNSPIDQYIPGRERAVANHLGIRVK